MLFNYLFGLMYPQQEIGHMGTVNKMMFNS